MRLWQGNTEGPPGWQARAQGEELNAARVALAAARQSTATGAGGGAGAGAGTTGDVAVSGSASSSSSRYNNWFLDVWDEAGYPKVKPFSAATDMEAVAKQLDDEVDAATAPKGKVYKLPTDVTVQAVATTAQLAEACAALSRARFVGVDCEWGTPPSGGGRSVVQTLQLAAPKQVGVWAGCFPLCLLPVAHTLWPNLLVCMHVCVCMCASLYRPLCLTCRRCQSVQALSCWSNTSGLFPFPRCCHLRLQYLSLTHIHNCRLPTQQQGVCANSH